MAIRNLDQLLEHLEKNAGDELDLLVSTGPEYYPTEQLYRILGQWQVKHQLFKKFNALVLRIAAYSPIWLFGGLLGIALGWRWVGLLLLALFPLSFFLFFAGLLFMRRFFRNKGHLDQVGETILNELKKRQITGQP